MDRGRQKHRRLTLLAIEYALFAIAALALGTYGFLHGRALFYREYDAWTFETTLAGERPSIRGFFVHRVDRLLGRERSPRPPAPRAEVPSPPPPPRTIDEKPPNQTEWSDKRIREYRESLESTRDTPMARLDIPSLDVSAMVFSGTDDWTLNRAVGHVDGSARPGQRGNVAIAGHRDSYFRPLGRIARNDRIILTTPQGTYRYRVDRTEIVRPEETRVLRRRSETPTLTLITCYPFYFVGDAPKRFIVQATLEGGAAETATNDSSSVEEARLLAEQPERRPPQERRVVRIHPPPADPPPPPAAATDDPSIEATEDAPPAAARAARGRPRLAKRIGRGFLGAIKKPFGLFRKRAKGDA